MSLATIDLKPGFVDRKLISEQPAAGALAKISNSTPIDLIGTQMQTIDFTGEMGIFGEGASNAVAAEQKKSSNDATNGVVTINPITFYISYRFPKKFLQLFGVNGAYNPTDATFRAGSPQTMLQSIVAQPYQAGILDQYRTYVNRAISRALDFAAIFGVNPATKAASNVARTNGYVLDKAGDINYTPGTGAEAATAFKQAVRQVAAQGDASAQGVTTSAYLSAIGDGLTTGGTPTQYASEVPLIGNMVYLGGVVSYATRLKTDLLGVTRETIANHTVVSEEVAIGMAVGLQRRTDADWVLAVTGVAGPDPQEGHDAGEVWICVLGPRIPSLPQFQQVERFDFSGDRDEIREQTVDAACRMLLRVVSPV